MWQMANSFYKESGLQNKVGGGAAKLQPAQCSNGGIEKVVKVVLYPGGSIYNLTCLSELAGFSNKNRESTVTLALQRELITFFKFFFFPGNALDFFLLLTELSHSIETG